MHLEDNDKIKRTTTDNRGRAIARSDIRLTCRVCGQKTTYFCTRCSHKRGPTWGLCIKASEGGKNCWLQHLEQQSNE